MCPELRLGDPKAWTQAQPKQWRQTRCVVPEGLRSKSLRYVEFSGTLSGSCLRRLVQMTYLPFPRLRLLSQESGHQRAALIGGQWCCRSSSTSCRVSISSLSGSSACWTTSLPETLSCGKVIHAAASEADRAGVLHEDCAAEGCSRSIGQPRCRSLSLRRRCLSVS